MLGGWNPLNLPFFGGLFPQAPDAFGFNPPSQLVLGYHWLAFLNQIHKNLSSPRNLKFCYTNFFFNLKIVFAYVLEHCAFFGLKSKHGHFRRGHFARLFFHQNRRKNIISCRKCSRSDVRNIRKQSSLGRTS